MNVMHRSPRSPTNVVRVCLDALHVSPSTNGVPHVPNPRSYYLSGVLLVCCILKH
jgi:hypothetical protein